LLGENKLIVAKNTTIDDINLDDLGIIIPGSSIIDLSDTFSLSEITSSIVLKTVVEGGSIIINDGIEDLSAEDGLRHITYETAYEDKLIFNKVVDASESSTYSLTWVEKLRLDLVDLVSADYALNWSFELRSNDNTINNFCESRISINSNVIASNSWPYVKYQYFSGADLGTISGNASIIIEYRRQGNYQPVYIRNVKISVIKLG
jgi:hypothetical protein